MFVTALLSLSFVVVVGVAAWGEVKSPSTGNFPKTLIWLLAVLLFMAVAVQFELLPAFLGDLIGILKGFFR